MKNQIVLGAPPRLSRVIAIVAICLTSFAYASDSSNHQPEMPKQTGFIKNVGQVYDFDKQLHPEVLYQLKQSAFNVYLTKTGLTYGIIKMHPTPFKSDSKDKFSKQEDLQYCDVARLEMELLNASIKTENITESDYDEQTGIINFYGDGLTENGLGLRMSHMLIIKEVYPGIDWILNADATQGMKFDFIVHAGADINNIKILYKGATGIYTDATKKILTISTKLGDIKEGELKCFQNNQPIYATYQLQGDVVSIKMDDYEKTTDLIIDPSILLERKWATYFGGPDADYINATKMDPINEEIYIVGYTRSSPFPFMQNGTAYFSNGFSGTKEAFISQFKSTGTQLWCTYFLSSEDDEATDVGVDGNQNVYMCGNTFTNIGSAINFPVLNSGGFYQGINNGPAGTGDAFLIKFNVAGNLLWSTLFGGDKNELCSSLSCNKLNQVFICGVTESTSNFPFKQQGGGYFDNSIIPPHAKGFIAGFDSNTKLYWGTYYGDLLGLSQDNCRHIECGYNNRIVVVGTTFGHAPGGGPAGSYQQGNNGLQDGFMVVFDQTTILLDATNIGGSNNDWIYSCDINDVNGIITLCGQTRSADLPFTNGGGYFDDNLFLSNSHSFIAQLNANFYLDWLTLFQGNGSDQALAVSTGDGGYFLVAGLSIYPSLAPQIFPLWNPGAPFYFDSTCDVGYTDAYIALFSPARDLMWCTYYGSNLAAELATDVEVNGRYVLLTGYSFSSSYTNAFSNVNEPGSYQQSFSLNLGGTTDGFIAKFYNQQNNNLRNIDVLANTDSGLFSIYPNPVKEGTFTIRLENLEQVKIVIKDALGKIVYIQQVQGSNVYSFKTNGFSKGLYFITVLDNDTIETKQILIK